MFVRTLFNFSDIGRTLALLVGGPGGRIPPILVVTTVIWKIVDEMGLFEGVERRITEENITEQKKNNLLV